MAASSSIKVRRIAAAEKVVMDWSSPSVQSSMPSHLGAFFNSVLKNSDKIAKDCRTAVLIFPAD
jgi:hypothetical protein